MIRPGTFCYALGFTCLLFLKQNLVFAHETRLAQWDFSISNSATPTMTHPSKVIAVTDLTASPSNTISFPGNGRLVTKAYSQSTCLNGVLSSDTVPENYAFLEVGITPNASRLLKINAIRLTAKKAVDEPLWIVATISNGTEPLEKLASWEVNSTDFQNYTSLVTNVANRTQPFNLRFYAVSSATLEVDYTKIEIRIDDVSVHAWIHVEVGYANICKCDHVQTRILPRSKCKGLVGLDFADVFMKMNFGTYCFC